MGMHKNSALKHWGPWGSGGRHIEVRSRNQRYGPIILEKSANPSRVGGWARGILKIQRPKSALYCVVNHNKLAYILEYENALRGG